RSAKPARDGVIVDASPGNAGSSPSVIGSPSTADGAISVAANDPWENLPGATLTFSGKTITAINANGDPFSSLAGLKIKVIANNPATPGNESLRCSVDDFGGPNSLGANTIAVVTRGNSARVATARVGQHAGDAAVTRE